MRDINGVVWVNKKKHEEKQLGAQTYHIGVWRIKKPNTRAKYKGGLKGDQRKILKEDEESERDEGV